MATDARVSALVGTLSSKESAEEDRVDAAVLLMELDKSLAEETIVRLLKMASLELFDFHTELLDVLLGEWAIQGKTKEVESLLDELPSELRRYAEAAWKNLTNLEGCDLSGDFRSS